MYVRFRVIEKCAIAAHLQLGVADQPLYKVEVAGRHYYAVFEPNARITVDGCYDSREAELTHFRTPEGNVLFILKIQNVREFDAAEYEPLKVFVITVAGRLIRTHKSVLTQKTQKNYDFLAASLAITNQLGVTANILVIAKKRLARALDKLENLTDVEMQARFLPAREEDVFELDVTHIHSFGKSEEIVTKRKEDNV